MKTRTMLLLVLALAGCEKGSGPTTTPDEATPEGEGGDPEEKIPDDEEAEGDEPY
jgi:predicted small lipoprotein YifL